VSDLEIVTEAHRHKNCCFMCKRIVEDWQKNGKLTDAPHDLMGKGDFPRDSKEKHIKLEKGITI
jgi:hypothetical protein